jgi:hypothetical protein
LIACFYTACPIYQTGATNNPAIILNFRMLFFLSIAVPFKGMPTEQQNKRVYYKELMDRANKIRCKY